MISDPYGHHNNQQRRGRADAAYKPGPWPECFAAQVVCQICERGWWTDKALTTMSCPYCQQPLTETRRWDLAAAALPPGAREAMARRPPSLNQLAHLQNLRDHAPKPKTMLQAFERVGVLRGEGRP